MVGPNEERDAAPATDGDSTPGGFFEPKGDAPSEDPRQDVPIFLPAGESAHLHGEPRPEITRDSGAYEIGFDGDVRDLRQMLMVFVLCSGAALGLLEASRRFDANSGLHGSLRWGALAVLMIGCGTVGFSLIRGALTDLRRAAEPPRPMSRRRPPSRSGAFFRLVLGIAMGVVVPAVALVSMLT